MHLSALVALFPLLLSVDANDRHVRLAKRQVASASASASTSYASASSISSASSTSSGSASPVPTTPVGTTIPPLSQITSGMPTPSTLPVTTTYSHGATPPISGAPTLPTPCTFASFTPVSHLTLRSRLHCKPVAPSGPYCTYQYACILLSLYTQSIDFSQLLPKSPSG